MADPSKNDDNKLNVTSIIITIITVVGTLVTGYFGYKTAYNNIWIPIITTQTAEARLLTQAAGQIVSTPTTSLPIETFTEIPSTATAVNTDTPSAPIPPSATVVPSLCCLAGWDVFSSDGASYPPSPSGDCSNIGVDELGIHASNCGLIFGKDEIKQRGVYGLSMPIQDNVTIQVTVSVTILIEGEFWIGFSNGTDPQAGSLIYAMTPDPGGVSVYFDDISSPYARYKWADMLPYQGWARGQPWVYNFTIQTEGSKVSVDVNSDKFSSMVALSTNRLFIGYASKPNTVGTYLNATVSNLKITNNP